jgi:hypothetical protein
MKLMTCHEPRAGLVKHYLYVLLEPEEAETGGRLANRTEDAEYRSRHRLRVAQHAARTETRPSSCPFPRRAECLTPLMVLEGRWERQPSLQGPMDPA